MVDDPNRSPLTRYLAEIGAFSPLSSEDEARLVGLIRAGNAAALNHLVQANLGFVVKVAAQYRSPGVPLEDLINEGNLGLIEAARRFDASRGT